MELAPKQRGYLYVIGRGLAQGPVVCGRVALLDSRVSYWPDRQKEGHPPNATYFEPTALAAGAAVVAFPREKPDASAFGSVEISPK